MAKTNSRSKKRGPARTGRTKGSARAAKRVSAGILGRNPPSRAATRVMPGGYPTG